MHGGELQIQVLGMQASSSGPVTVDSSKFGLQELDIC